MLVAGVFRFGTVLGAGRCASLSLLGLLGLAIAAETPKQVRVENATLTYIERGRGTPVIFIPGGLSDYTRWSLQMEPFGAKYHVFAYSRRFNYPNKNVPIADYSAYTDADDLAAMFDRLHIGPAYIIAESYGAFGALVFAIKRPELTRALVLSEPALPWRFGKIEGPIFRRDFWNPVANALRDGRRNEAKQMILDHFAGGMKLEDLPPADRADLENNLHEWEVLTNSREPFPVLPKADVSHISAPVLMLSGEQTLEDHKLIDAELEKLLPNVQRIVVKRATHEMWVEQPDECRRLAFRFLAGHP